MNASLTLIWIGYFRAQMIDKGQRAELTSALAGHK